MFIKRPYKIYVFLGVHFATTRAVPQVDLLQIVEVAATVTLTWFEATFSMPFDVGHKDWSISKDRTSIWIDRRRTRAQKVKHAHLTLG